MRILFLAALPQEYGPFLKLSGPWRRLQRKPNALFVRSHFGKELFLVETGMGKDAMKTALKRAVVECSPELLISIGFAGSLCETLETGDAVIGREFVSFDPGSSPAGEGRLFFESSAVLSLVRERTGAAEARIVTSGKPQPKSALQPLFEDAPSVMDMESYVAARFASAAGIPFLCFRSVSDGLGDEIDFDLGAISDSAGRVRVVKVMAAALREPRLVKSFFLSWRRSVMASDRLARALEVFLGISSDALAELSAQCRLRGEERE